MASLNRATILGNLGGAPELKRTDAGRAVCTLSVATNRKWVEDDGTKREAVEWHRVVVWGKQAESCAQYLEKGSQVYCEGRLETRKWTDDKGVDRWTTQIVASPFGVTFLGSGKGGSRPPEPEPSHLDDDYVPSNPDTDDIPF